MGCSAIVFFNRKFKHKAYEKPIDFHSILNTDDSLKRYIILVLVSTGDQANSKFLLPEFKKGVFSSNATGHHKDFTRKLIISFKKSLFEILSFILTMYNVQCHSLVSIVNLEL